MSSVSLDRMTEAGVPDIISDMTTDIFGQVGTYPRFLLPIKYCYSYYDAYTQIEFRNTYNGVRGATDLYIETWSNEKERINAIQTINHEILELNDTIDEHNLERAPQDRVQHFETYDENAFVVFCREPVHKKNWVNKHGRKLAERLIDPRNFYNEEIYYRMEEIESVQDKCDMFNRMMLEYLTELTEDVTLLDESTFHYPILEFQDWEMTTRSQSPNLLFKKTSYQEQKIVQEELPKKPSPFSEVLFHNRGGKHAYNPDATDSDFSLSHYEIQVNLNNQTLTLEKNKAAKWKSNKRTAIADIKECGFQGRGKEPSVLLQLLYKYFIKFV